MFVKCKYNISSYNIESVELISGSSGTPSGGGVFYTNVDQIPGENLAFFIANYNRYKIEENSIVLKEGENTIGSRCIPVANWNMEIPLTLQRAGTVNSFGIL